jgi:hypothetical protein
MDYLYHALRQMKGHNSNTNYTSTASTVTSSVNRYCPIQQGTYICMIHSV